MIERNRLVLAARRPADKAQPLLWEFPGGKIEAGESGDDALIREIHEELGIVIEPHFALPTVVHDYPSFTIALHPWRCRLIKGEPIAHEHAEIRWCTIDDLKSLDWAPADIPVLEDYLRR